MKLQQVTLPAGRIPEMQFAGSLNGVLEKMGISSQDSGEFSYPSCMIELCETLISAIIIINSVEIGPL